MNRTKENKKSYYLSEEALKQYYKECLSQDNDKQRIFVLINRKGYWDYRILFHGERTESGIHLVMSDRMLDKCPNDELDKLLSGKEVVVYDDSLTNGGNLFYYFMLCKKHGAEKVIPVVYALNADFPSERSYRLMEREAERAGTNYLKKQSVKKMIKEFVQSLSYRIVLGSADIDKMSVWQTQLFQKHLSPLVMDLPIFNHVRGSKDDSIEMGWIDFERLIKNRNNNWEYVENDMHGWGKTIRASYFRLRHQLVDEGICRLFHDLVVKCKYEREGSRVKVVFTPFAIVKSIDFDEVFQFFKLLYEDTEYGKKVLVYFEGKEILKVLKEDHGLCRALFRAVIFRLSDYIGRKFQVYIKQVLEMDIEYDWDMMHDNFDEDFINTQKKLYDAFVEEDFLKRVYQFQSNRRIPAIKPKKYLMGQKMEATQERINIFMRDVISEKKQNIDAPLCERIYTFETLENDLEQRFLFEDAWTRREMITNVCLLFLETNSFSNILVVINDEQIIFRGFRYGENSEIFLHENLWFFYAYLHAFYEIVPRELIKDKYGKFMNLVEEHLVEAGYLGQWISEDGFRFLKQYFSRFGAEELVDEIKRRKYLLESWDYGEEYLIRKKMIDKVKNTVIQWGGV